MPEPSETDAQALRAAVEEMRESAASMKSSAATMTDQVASAVSAVGSLNAKMEGLAAVQEEHARKLEELQFAGTRPKQTTLTELASPPEGAPPGAAPLSSSIRAIENVVRDQPSKGESRFLTLAILAAMTALEIIRRL